MKGLIKRDIVMASKELKKVIKKMVKPTKAQQAISRSEILDEIWAANKHTIDGKWYVSLSDVCAILGEDYVSREA